MPIGLVTPGRHLSYRALSVAEPFGAPPGPHVEWPAITRELGVRWIPDLVTRVDPERRVAETRDGAPLRYDSLLLALGARPEPALPGAIAFAGPRDVVAVQDALAALKPGGKVAFVAVAGATWTLPLYELALLTAERGRRARLGLTIDLITSEAAPLGVFGAEASALVADRLTDAGIRLRTATFATAVEDGSVWLELEGPLACDVAIALPRLRGPALPGLPHDEHGFVPVDEYCRVRGVDGVWAVGDMTSRALKQGGLAAQQADVAAVDIAAAAGAPVTPEPYRPVLEGLLLTGAEGAYLERRPGGGHPARAAATPHWSPAHKVAGRFVAPYLARSGRLDRADGVGEPR
jgi:sulfide:quinone oxidoreductase